MKFDQVIAIWVWIAPCVMATPTSFTARSNDKPPGEHQLDHDTEKKYGWDLGRCNWCPSDLNSWLEDGYKSTCPEDKKQCQKYVYDYSTATYSGSFSSKQQRCPEADNYAVSGKIGPCNVHGFSILNGNCLNVEYRNWEKWIKKVAYIGVYSTKREGPEHEMHLNSNIFCDRERCAIPIELIPGYPKFEDSVWIGFDGDQCKPTSGGEGRKKDRKEEDSGDSKKTNHEGTGEEQDKDHKKGGNGESRRSQVKYIELEIEAKDFGRCEKFCCCA